MCIGPVKKAIKCRASCELQVYRYKSSEYRSVCTCAKTKTAETRQKVRERKLAIVMSEMALECTNLR